MRGQMDEYIHPFDFSVGNIDHLGGIRRREKILIYLLFLAFPCWEGQGKHR